jgi:hypothetical protein
MILFRTSVFNKIKITFINYIFFNLLCKEKKVLLILIHITNLNEKNH